jgi:hypothetical protein
LLTFDKFHKQMKSISQKLAVAATSVAIGFAALEAAPAKAASFALDSGRLENRLAIRFSGTVNFTSENRGTMGLDGLDSFQATYRYYDNISQTNQEARWEKSDLSSFSFYYSPESVYLGPLAPRPTSLSPPLALQAINTAEERLRIRKESFGFTDIFIPRECPPEAPPGSNCGLYEEFRTGWRSVELLDDNSTAVPEPTTILGLALGIGWLIKKKQASSVKP